MNWPSTMAKSSRSQPYKQSRYAPARLSTQKIDGDSTWRALSDSIHCTNMRAEKNPCARKPIAKTAM